MRPFRAGDVVRPKNKLLPIDSEPDGRTGKRHQITEDVELLVNVIGGDKDEQRLTFRGKPGSYDSSFFVRVEKK